MKEYTELPKYTIQKNCSSPLSKESKFKEKCVSFTVTQGDDYQSCELPPSTVPKLHVATAIAHQQNRRLTLSHRLHFDYQIAGDGDECASTNNMKKFNNQKHETSKEATVDCAMWTDGLICAFEAKRGHKKCRPQDIIGWKKQGFKNGIDSFDERANDNTYAANYWVPIGWARINQLVETIQVDGYWETQHKEFKIDDNEVTVADIAAPYWEQPGGPTWWCHVDAGHISVNTWLSNSKWLHPAISIALRDESKLISERMKHLLYEVPVRVAGGLLFELLGQSAGDPYIEEDDIPVVLRSWQAQNFLVTALHVKGYAANVNVLGVSEVQELLAAGGGSLPQSIHEVIALLACRLARWDDRLFRKYIFGAADEVELKFMNRRNQEDLHLFSIILNQEIRRLSSQVIRVKWSLHAREEIVFELLQHLRGNAAKCLLEGMTKSTRQMIEEQEAVRGRLFTVQDVMQSTVRAWLQDKSLRVTHNLGVFGGCGLVLSIITGLFGINVDGIPGSENSPFAFLLFSCVLALLGIILIFIGLLYLGLKNPVIEKEVEVRKIELQEIVKMFQQEAESHAQLRKSDSKNQMPSVPGGNDSYVLLH